MTVKTGEHGSLGRWPTFSALAAAQLAAIERAGEDFRVSRNKFLFWEGEPFAHVDLVLAGRMVLLREGPRAGTFSIREAGVGDCLELPGGMGLHSTHAVSARAEEASIVARVPLKAFLSSFESAPVFSRECARLALRWAYELQERLTLAYGPGRDRLAHHLQRLSADGTLPIRRSKRELAALAGMREVTVFRLLRDFRRLGWVRSQAGILTVTAPAEIAAAAAGR